MNEMKGSDASKSAFVGLKAELLKKKEEVKRIKDQLDKNKLALKPKKNVVIKKSNKGVEKRNLNDFNKEFEVDTDVLRKSREVLEAKAKLYDKLNKRHSSSISTERSQYLIDFDVKHELSLKIEHSQPPIEAVVDDDFRNSSDSESDWVEFEDVLGRTRKCLRKDLEEMKAKDLKLSSSLRPPTPPPRTQQLLSVDMQREHQRQKWEEQEAALIGKSNVHYQDVLFDEARAHGVAYFEFSTNEEERLRQLDALKHLHNETIEKQQAVEALHARRQQQLKARLAAARKRRQERLGLPFEELESQELEMTIPQPKDQIKDDLKITDMEENIKKIASDRPWDIGKQGVDLVLSQDEWVEKKRAERPEEFAPPNSLLKNLACIESNRPIPKSVQSYNGESNLKTLFKNNPESYHDQLHETNNQKYSSSVIPEDLRLTPTSKVKFSGAKRFEEHSKSNKCSEEINKTFKHIKTPIQNQVLKEDSCMTSYAPPLLEQSTKEFRNAKRKWAEIGPPATMEYFAGNLSSNKNRKTEKVDLAESLSAGLNYLTTLTAKKNKTRIKGLLDKSIAK